MVTPPLQHPYRFFLHGSIIQSLASSPTLNCTPRNRVIHPGLRNNLTCARIGLPCPRTIFSQDKRTPAADREPRVAMTTYREGLRRQGACTRCTLIMSRRRACCPQRNGVRSWNRRLLYFTTLAVRRRSGQSWICVLTRRPPCSFDPLAVGDRPWL